MICSGWLLRSMFQRPAISCFSPLLVALLQLLVSPLPVARALSGFDYCVAVANMNLANCQGGCTGADWGSCYQTCELGYSDELSGCFYGLMSENDIAIALDNGGGGGSGNGVPPPDAYDVLGSSFALLESLQAHVEPTAASVRTGASSKNPYFVGTSDSGTMPVSVVRGGGATVRRTLSRTSAKVRRDVELLRFGRAIGSWGNGQDRDNDLRWSLTMDGVDLRGDVVRVGVSDLFSAKPHPSVAVRSAVASELHAWWDEREGEKDGNGSCDVDSSRALSIRVDSSELSPMRRWDFSGCVPLRFDPDAREGIWGAEFDITVGCDSVAMWSADEAENSWLRLMVSQLLLKGPPAEMELQLPFQAKQKLDFLTYDLANCTAVLYRFPLFYRSSKHLFKGKQIESKLKGSPKQTFFDIGDDSEDLQGGIGMESFAVRTERLELKQKSTV